MKPKINNIIMLPEPIAGSDGKLYTTIVIGTGTQANDAILYAINGTADKDSPKATTIMADKSWLWLVPESVGLKANDQLTLFEKSSADDNSNLENGNVTDNSSDWSSGVGQSLLNQLKEVIENYPASTTITDITNIITKITKYIDDGQNSDTKSVTINFADQQNFVFTPSETGQGSDPTTKTQASLTNASNKTIDAKSVQWKLIDGSGNDLTTDKVPVDVSYDSDTGKVTLTSKNNNAAKAMAGQSYSLEVNGIYDDGSTFTATHDFSLLQLGFNTSELIPGQTVNLQLTGNIDAMKTATVTWQKFTVDKNTATLTSSADSNVKSQDIALTMSSNGDTYQLKATLSSGKTVYSNVIQINGLVNPISLLDVPDLDFGDIDAQDVFSGKFALPVGDNTHWSANGFGINSMTGGSKPTDASGNGTISVNDDKNVGWNLAVTLTSFKNTSGTMVVKDPILGFMQSANVSGWTYNLCYVNQATSILTTSGSQQIDMNSYNDYWKPTEKLGSARLFLPGGTNLSSGTYKSELTWTLSGKTP